MRSCLYLSSGSSRFLAGLFNNNFVFVFYSATLIRLWRSLFLNLCCYLTNQVFLYSRNSNFIFLHLEFNASRGFYFPGLIKTKVQLQIIALHRRTITDSLKSQNLLKSHTNSL